MKKEEKNEEWDLKKILITLFFLIVGFLVLVEAKKMFLPNVKILGDSASRVVVKKPDVQPPVNVQSAVESKINQIKDSVSNLDAQEVATSSPQIQKVLHDIGELKDLPADQAKQQCLKICQGL
jgi:hypothetical protein